MKVKQKNQSETLKMIEIGSSKVIQRIILITVVVTMIMILITLHASHSMNLKICNEILCCYPLSIYQAHIVILILLYSVT